jgi:hypothetical protein
MSHQQRRRNYTLDDYRRDVAKLYKARKSDAPGVSQVLHDALAAEAEIDLAEVVIPVPSSAPPPMSIIQRRKPRER